MQIASILLNLDKRLHCIPDIKGLRLGVPRRFFPDATDPEVQRAFATAVNVLEGLGAHIEDSSPGV